MEEYKPNWVLVFIAVTILSTVVLAVSSLGAMFFTLLRGVL